MTPYPKATIRAYEVEEGTPITGSRPTFRTLHLHTPGFELTKDVAESLMGILREVMDFGFHFGTITSMVADPEKDSWTFQIQPKAT